MVTADAMGMFSKSAVSHERRLRPDLPGTFVSIARSNMARFSGSSTMRLIAAR